MHHLLEHINQDIKGDKAKKRAQQLMKLNTGAKEIQQVNAGGPDNSQSIRPLPSHQYSGGANISDMSQICLVVQCNSISHACCVYLFRYACL